MLPEFSVAQLAFLSALVFFAGVVDALAGGGGLITVPAYLAVGLPPHLVLGTNKMVSSIGTVASALRFHARLRFSLTDFFPVLTAGLIGSFLGARLALHLDPHFLRYLLVFALPLVAYAVYSRHSFGERDRSGELSDRELLNRSLFISAPIGAYDGFFGPGTGTFLALAFTRFCRYDLLGSTGRAKLLNLASNLAALLAFLQAGSVHWRLGLSLAALSVAGHWTGSHIGLRKGAAAIRPMVLLVCAGLFLKILRDLLLLP